MSTKVPSKKVKKPVDLPLGKASLPKEVDLSHVRMPIDTSVFGLKQVLSLFETATNEVKSYLAYECDLMYECRLCRTIFRSLANFVLHKRKYCRDKYNPLENPSHHCHETDGFSIIEKDIECANKIVIETEDFGGKRAPVRHLDPIIEKLLKKHEHKKFVEDIKNKNLSEESKTENHRKCKTYNNILLEKIDTSGVAVFQTAGCKPNLGSEEFMKSEWLDNVEGDNDLQMCGGCGKRFERKAALTSHSVMCTKRIAICNSIKENNAKKRELDDRENKLKNKMLKLNKPQISGSAKRKPENLITYKPKSDCSLTESNVVDEKKQEKIKNEGDVVVKEVDQQLLCEKNVIIISDKEGSNREQGLDLLKKEELDEEHPTSIVEIDLNNLDHSDSPSKDSVENFSSKVSNRSESPCRGFENNQPLNLPELTRIFPFKGIAEDNNTTHFELNIPKESDEIEAEIVVPIVPKVTSEISTGSAIDNYEISDSVTKSSRITFNNNLAKSICENYDLPTCDSLNVSFKSLIKNIFSEDAYEENIEPINDEQNTEDNENESTAEDLNSITVFDSEHTMPMREINSSTQTSDFNKESSSPESVELVSIELEPPNKNSEHDISQFKRKRLESTLGGYKVKRSTQVRSESDDSLTETEDETFISIITPYTNIENLSCTVCDSIFSSLSHLLIHMSIHFSWYRYQCSRCPFMSYNKHDCEYHARKSHRLPSSKLRHTVLPIPSWKTVDICNSKKGNGLITENEELLHCEDKIALQLDTEITNEQESVMDDNKMISNRKSTIDNKVEHVAADRQEISCEKVVDFIDLTEDVDENVNIPEESCVTINTEQEIELPISQTKCQLSPDMSKQAILEVILGNESKQKNYKKKGIQESTTEYIRPPRNRVKSIKTSQKDFIYDLNIVRSKSVKANSSNITSKHIKVSENAGN